jgi:hypothetical protein
MAKKPLDSELQNYRDDGIEKVEICCTSSSCEVCKKAAEFKYLLEQAPELPIAGCTSEQGCTCCYIPVVD